jgi:O-antigen/teichoic acid export membrane protein
MMFGLLAVARPFILVVFGANWQPAILLIMIFALVGLLESIATTVGAIYQAKGRTDWMFRWEIASGVFTVTAFVVGLRWGIVGVATAYAAASLCLCYPNFAIPFRLIDLGVLKLIRVLYKPFAISFVMFLAMLALGQVLPRELSTQAALGLSVGMGTIIYCSMSWVMSRAQLKELWGLVSKIGHAA